MSEDADKRGHNIDVCVGLRFKVSVSPRFVAWQRIIPLVVASEKGYSPDPGFQMRFYFVWKPGSCKRSAIGGSSIGSDRIDGRVSPEGEQKGAIWLAERPWKGRPQKVRALYAKTIACSYVDPPTLRRGAPTHKVSNQLLVTNLVGWSFLEYCPAWRLGRKQGELDSQG